MLSVITCDAPVTPDLWRAMFRRGSVNSWNQITVDGDTSTNDTVIGLASGMAGGEGERAWAEGLDGWSGMA
jgi:glutamate N-acetyltransferase/amino-acid N-acetyltransferase